MGGKKRPERGLACRAHPKGCNEEKDPVRGCVPGRHDPRRERRSPRLFPEPAQTTPVHPRRPQKPARAAFGRATSAMTKAKDLHPERRRISQDGLQAGGKPGPVGFQRLHVFPCPPVQCACGALIVTCRALRRPPTGGRDRARHQPCSSSGALRGASPLEGVAGDASGGSGSGESFPQLRSCPKNQMERHKEINDVAVAGRSPTVFRHCHVSECTGRVTSSARLTWSVRRRQASDHLA